MEEDGERLIAFDPLGAGDGERVLVTQGSVAKGWFKDGKAVDRRARSSASSIRREASAKSQ